MSDELLVFAGASKRSRLLDLLERQLAEAGLPFYIHIHPRHSRWEEISGVGAWLRLLELALSLGYGKYACIDAFDMLFCGTAGELAGKIAGEDVVFCADRNLVPPELGEENFPPAGTPWRFLNGGGLVGTREALARLVSRLREVDSGPGETNNALLNRLLISGEDWGFRIDSQAEVFHNLYLGEEGELIPREGRPWNALTGAFPSFIHFAGGTRPEALLRAYGIDYEIPPERWIRGEFPHYY